MKWNYSSKVQVPQHCTDSTWALWGLHFITVVMVIYILNILRDHNEHRVFLPPHRLQEPDSQRAGLIMTYFPFICECALTNTLFVCPLQNSEVILALISFFCLVEQMLDHLQLVSVQQLLITVLVARWWKMAENFCLHRFRSRRLSVLLTSVGSMQIAISCLSLLWTYVLTLEDLWCDAGVNTDPSPKSRWLPGAASSDWTKKKQKYPDTSSSISCCWLYLNPSEHKQLFQSNQKNEYFNLHQ